MNILLAFKAEPDLSMLAEADWQEVVRRNEGPEAALVRVAMGNDERGAGELMLQAREVDPSLTLSAMTVGDERALPALRHLMALGFEQTLLLECRQDLRFSPALIADHIACQAQQQQSGLVLVGSQSSEGQNHQTGWLTAEKLGWPCLAQVSGLLPMEGGFLVQCGDPSRRRQWLLRQPAVLMVQNRGQLALRVPGMRARLAAASAEIVREQCDFAGARSSLCIALAREVQRRAGKRIDGQTTEEKIQKLWHDYLAQRMTP